MTEVLGGEEARRKFAEERSHRDSGVSNENARATGQASILINGGAATAILALLAKEKMDPTVLKTACWCLVGYAVGVVAGAGMLFSSTQSLDYYADAWRLRAHPISTRTPESSGATALSWLRRMQTWRSSFRVLSLLGRFITQQRRNRRRTCRSAPRRPRRRPNQCWSKLGSGGLIALVRRSVEGPFWPQFRLCSKR